MLVFWPVPLSLCVRSSIWMLIYCPDLKSVLNIHWKDWCWSWSSGTLTTWWEELTHRKRPWCWERLKVGGEGDDRGWDGWVSSLTQWIWVWGSSRSWWWTGNPGVLQSMESQRVGHDWVTKLNQLKPLNQTRSSLFNESNQKCVGLFLVDVSDNHKNLRSPF